MKWWIFPKRSSSFRNGSCKHKQREVFARRGKLRFLSLNLKRMLLTDLSLSPELSKLKKNPCRESIIIFGNQKKVWKWNRMYFLYKLNWKSQYCCFITRYSMGEKSTHIRVKFKNLTLIYVVSSKLTLMYVVSSKKTLKWGSYIHSGHFMKWP